MEFSTAGREKRFAAFDTRGLAAVKSDLESTDRSAIGGPAAISLAWEWVVMQEAAEREAGTTSGALPDRPSNRLNEIADRKPWIATVDWKAALRQLWSR